MTKEGHTNGPCDINSTEGGAGRDLSLLLVKHGGLLERLQQGKAETPIHKGASQKFLVYTSTMIEVQKPYDCFRALTSLKTICIFE